MCEEIERSSEKESKEEYHEQKEVIIILVRGKVRYCVQR